jgi:hypothetical protein
MRIDQRLKNMSDNYYQIRSEYPRAFRIGYSIASQLHEALSGTPIPNPINSVHGIKLFDSAIIVDPSLGHEGIVLT